MNSFKLIFSVKGMHCASCTSRIEQTLKKKNGIKDVSVSLATSTAQVTMQEQPTPQTVQEILETITGLGFEAAEQQNSNRYLAPDNKLELSIQGMHCASCSSRIEHILRKFPEVVEASVNLGTNSATIKLQSPPTDSLVEALLAAISNLGFDPSLQETTNVGLGSAQERWESHNLSMQAELAERKRDLIPAFAFALPLLVISMGEMFGLPLPSFFSPDQSFSMFALLQLALCLPVMFAGRRFFSRGLIALWRKAPNMDTLVALGTGAAFAFSLGVTINYILEFGFISPAASHGMMPETLGHASFGISMLEMFFGLGEQNGIPHLYYESAAMVIALVSLGKYLEIRSRMQTGEAIKALLDLAPETAVRLVSPNNVTSMVQDKPSYALWNREEIALEKVQKHDILLVTPGGRIPVDGLVLDGESFVDEAMLTGESMPVHKKADDKLTAGTMNGQGALFMRAENIGADTVLARIVQMVQEAQGSKAPIAGLADKVSLYFVPVIIAVAALSGIFWFMETNSLSTALHFTVAVLVIACPCAMGLATPMSIMVGCGRGAQLGVLFKNGQALENTSRLDTLVFDKTGTLTVGKPSLTNMVVLDGAAAILPTDLRFPMPTMEHGLAFTPKTQTENLCLQIAAALESSSEHPIAKAITKAAASLNLELLPLRDFKAHMGLGAEGTVDIGGKEQQVKIGTAAFILGQNAQKSHELLLNDMAEQARTGATPILLSVDGIPCAMLAVADSLNPNTIAAVKELHQSGIKTVMLTGDTRLTAEYIAKQAGIDMVVADVLPEGKAAVITDLQKAGKVVGMVGDGINDAPALAKADVGFAVGSGIDIAVQTGDVVLMGSGISHMDMALRLGRSTMRNIRQNLFWAFAYNVVGVPFAAGIFYYFGGPALSPMLAGLAMALSSFSVVSNALRLRFIKI